jgi:SAM-dependent methyltransferase
MLENKFGIFRYLLSRNDIVWERLSEEEKQLVFKANLDGNNAHYANPEEYGRLRVEGGQVFDSSVDRLSLTQGKILQAVLLAHNPATILEIGPGSGFYTRLICEYETVRNYTAVDIVRPFLDYLEPRLQGMVQAQQLDGFRLIHDDFMQIELAPADLIVMLSAVHHIPNRVELFQKLSTYLTENGRIICLEPTHYLSRMLHLTYRYLKRFHKREFWSDYRNLSTHAFCTYEEFVKIVQALPEMEIAEVYFDISRKANWLRRLVNSYDPESFWRNDKFVYQKAGWLRWFAFQMGLVLKKSK